MGAVPWGTGWLPWVSGRKMYEVMEDGAIPSGGGVGRRGGGGRDGGGELARLLREGDAARVLSEAVEHYKMACEADGGGSRRGLFAMGWLHQVRLCVCV